MRKDARKAAVTAYKERKVVAGIYAVRCVATGLRWVGSARDLATVQNRLWFTLRQGGSPNRNLQAAWNEHGPDGFAFEEVERLAEEDDPHFRDRLLKDRLARCRTALSADQI